MKVELSVIVHGAIFFGQTGETASKNSALMNCLEVKKQTRFYDNFLNKLPVVIIGEDV